MAGEWYAYDVLANIHYGYVGRSIGFPDEALLFFAGMAQIKNQAVDPFVRTFAKTRSLREAWNTIHWENIGPPETFFDDPADAAAIRVGMELYKEYGYDINAERLGEILERYEGQLHEGTPPTDSLPTTQEERGR